MPLRPRRSSGRSRGRRQDHRTRHADGRGNRQTDGREGDLAEHAAHPRSSGTGLSGRFGPAREGGRGLVRHRHDLRVGEEVQAQDRMGHRCPVLPRAGAATRGHSGLTDPLWYTPAEALIMATSTAPASLPLPTAAQAWRSVSEKPSNNRQAGLTYKLEPFVRCPMKLQSPHLTDYLQCTPIIDWATPAIVEQTQTITRGLTHDTAKAQALFEWVRDAIPHSWDARTDIVTCTASEVLAQRTGLCYAKSHLLAAMLRCTGIPAGFCYQVFRRNAPYNGLALHGLNGLYLPSVARWVWVDARGNTGTI